jgi:hypothetical protein
MRCSLKPRRRAVSNFLEVFILIGVALGGSGIVLGVGLAYASLPNASFSITGLSISQGSYSTIETMTILDSGETQLGPFTLITQGAPVTSTYCYSVLNPASRALISSTCPSMAEDPGSVRIAVTISPGQGITLELLIEGEGFILGSSHMVTVTASSGAQQGAEVQVLPA